MGGIKVLAQVRPVWVSPEKIDPFHHTAHDMKRLFG